MATITVEVTDDKYKVLTHQPSGAAFDEDGKSEWPADQFTYRLVAEGSIRTVADTASPPPAQSDEK